MKWFEKLYLKLFGSKCLVCEGSGRVPIGKGYMMACWRCGGVGKVERY